MYPSPRLVAILLALMLARSTLTRARISDRSFRVVSRRVTLRTAFIANVRSWLEDLGVVLLTLDRGGYALVSIAALNGARPILARNLIADELQRFRANNLDEGALWDELGLNYPDNEE